MKTFSLKILLYVIILLASSCADKGQLVRGGSMGASHNNSDSVPYGPAIVGGKEARFFISFDTDAKVVVNATPKNTLEYAWAVEAQLGDTLYQFSLRYFSFGEVNQHEADFAELFKTAKPQINIVRSLHTGEQHVVVFSEEGIRAEALSGGLLLTVTNENLVSIFAREKPERVKFVTPGAKQKSNADEVVKVEYN